MEYGTIPQFDSHTLDMMSTIVYDVMSRSEYGDEACIDLYIQGAAHRLLLTVRTVLTMVGRKITWNAHDPSFLSVLEKCTLHAISYINILVD
jgi:hypothetical protein